MKSNTETIGSYPQADSLLRTLYLQYAERKGPDGKEINRSYEKLYQLLEDLSRQKQNSVECAVNELCAAVERIAFLDGVRNGAKLVLELME